MLDKMAAIQMVDVHLPTTDGRTVLLSRYTEPTPDQLLLLRQLKMELPAQPPPKDRRGRRCPSSMTTPSVVPTFPCWSQQNPAFGGVTR